jgi:hypothetical protein
MRSTALVLLGLLPASSALALASPRLRVAESRHATGLRRTARVAMAEAAPVYDPTAQQQPPTAAQRASLRDARPSPSVQPREVITAVMMSLHRSCWDEPTPFFGFEVALRFLSPTHHFRSFAADGRGTPQEFSRYMRQPHKTELLHWGEWEWQGETAIMGDHNDPVMLLEQKEAYQQMRVRRDAAAPWVSVRWMLVRAEPSEWPHPQWMVDAVFVSEPDEVGCGYVQPEPAAAAALDALDAAEQRALFKSRRRALSEPLLLNRAASSARRADEGGHVCAGPLTPTAPAPSRPTSSATRWARSACASARRSCASCSPPPTPTPTASSASTSFPRCSRW